MKNKIIFILLSLMLISVSSVFAWELHAPIEINEIEDTVVLLGNTYTKQVTYNDEVGVVNFSISNQPTGMTISETGLIQWTPLATQVNVYSNILVNVVDSRTNDTVGNHDSEAFTLDVRENIPNVVIAPTAIVFQGEKGTTSSPVIVTIKNTGGQDLTNVDIDFLQSNGNNIESTIMSVSGTWDQTLDIDETITLTLTGIIPAEMDGGVESLYGYMKFTANGTTLPIEKRSNIYFKTNSNLEIQEIELYINGDDEETFKSSGKSFDELKDGDEIKLIIHVENLHDDNEMVDVFATLSVESSSGWDEFVDDEESDELDIDDGDEEELEISFKLNADDLDEESEDSATFTVIVEGEDDETGYTHFDTWTFTLEIDREKDEISLIDIRMTPSTVYCTDSQIQINVDYKNTGSNEQDEGRITISNTQLNIFEEYEFDELESKESDDKTFVISVPSNLESGNYNFIITAYNEDDDETDEKVVTLQSLCTSNVDNENEDDEEYDWIINPNQNNQDDDDATTFQPAISGDSNFRNSPLYITLLIIMIILVIVGIVMLSILISKRD